MAIDEELLQQFLKDLEKNGKILDTVASSMDAYGRGVQSKTEILNQQIRADKKLIDQIQKNAELHGVMNIQDQVELDQLKDRIKQNTKSLKLEDERVKRNAEYKEALKKITPAMITAAGSTVAMNNSVYSSEKAFTAVVPTLQMVGEAFKTVSAALFSMGSAIPVVGGLSESAGKIVSAAVSVATQVAEMQIQNAQKYVDTYTALSKVGVTFGGAIEKMRISATAAGMNLDSYSKFITHNIESLNHIGGSAEEGASAVTKFSKGLAQGNPKLLAMYGSMEDLMGGTADYYAMLSTYGTNVKMSNASLSKGAADYLYNMKELSALTGQSVDVLKKQDEARARSAAFQLALGEMEKYQRQNTNYAIDQIQAKYGEKVAAYAQELIATNGHVTSTMALQLQSFFPDMAKTVQMSLQTTNQSTEDFRKSNAELITARATAINDEMKQRKSLAQLQAGGAAGNEVLELMNSIMAPALKSAVAQTNTAEAQANLAKKFQESTTSATQTYTQAINSLNSFKMKIDEQTEKTLPKVGEMVNSLYTISEVINEKIGKNLVAIVDNYAIPSIQRLADELDKITSRSATEKKKEETKKLYDKVWEEKHGKEGWIDQFLHSQYFAGGADRIDPEHPEKYISKKSATLTDKTNSIVPEAPARPVPVEVVDATTKHAKGGVTNGPSMAGEAGPEAVVPLPDGKTIPVNIDMSEIVKKLDELIRINKDHRNTSEKILHASA